MLKRFITIFLLMIMTVSIVACSSSKDSNSDSSSSVKKPRTLVIAYLPDEATDKKMEYRKGIQDAMSKTLGVKVKEFLCSDYNAAIEAMRTGKADIANFGPLSYVQAHARAKAEALVIPALNSDKKNAGYYSYILTQHNNNSINSINDLKGKTFAFVDPNSTSGNLLPSKSIMEAYPDLKLSIDDLHTNGKFFKSVTYSNAHENGLIAVSKGDIDAAPCASDIFNRETSNGNVDKSKVKIIYTSPLIPASPVAIRGTLDKKFIEQVRNFYLKYDNDTFFKNFVGEKDGERIRYVLAEDSDYKTINDLAEKFGLK